MAQGLKACISEFSAAVIKHQDEATYRRVYLDLCYRELESIMVWTTWLQVVGMTPSMNSMC